MRVLPLDTGGAAAEIRMPDGIEDRTGWPRFGLKGPGTLEWFAQQGLPLPDINRVGRIPGLRVCRLGHQDILLLSESEGSEAINQKQAAWEQAPLGYSSWREEAWAWLSFTEGAAQKALPRLTAIDLRPQAFGLDGILQTRAAHQDAVIMRNGGGIDLFFDIASTAQVVHDIAQTLGAGEHPK